MLEERFSYDSFSRADDPRALSTELQDELTERIRAADSPEDEGRRIINELRNLGHDLWSFDESDDFQLWCGSWVAWKHPYELIVEMSYRADEPRAVAVTFRSVTR